MNICQEYPSETVVKVVTDSRFCSSQFYWMKRFKITPPASQFGSQQYSFFAHNGKTRQCQGPSQKAAARLSRIVLTKSLTPFGIIHFKISRPTNRETKCWELVDQTFDAFKTTHSVAWIMLGCWDRTPRWRHGFQAYIDAYVIICQESVVHYTNIFLKKRIQLGGFNPTANFVKLNQDATSKGHT